MRTTAVIGAGSMGSGIAAHMANAGFNVILLDMTAEIAVAGVERQIKSRGFYDPAFASRIRTGSIEEDRHLLADATWVVEAIVEDVGAKRELYAKLAPVLPPDALVTSNTSTIPVADLVKDLPEECANRFAITHFFNPPRLMPLVEVVPGPGGVDDDLVTMLADDLGKHVLICRDSPGFVANRVGSYWMSVGAARALEQGIDLELADAAFSKPVGVPRTGIFGLFDYIGLQVVPSVWNSLIKALPADDTFRRFDWLVESEPFTWLLDNGLTGRTGPSGFYRGRGEVLDPQAVEYRPVRPVDDPVVKARGIADAIQVDSIGGRYVWDVYATTLAYCCDVAAEVAGTVADIDDALVYGYSWKQGPFAMADSIGMDTLIDRFAQAEREVPALLQAAHTAGGFYPGPTTVLNTTGHVIERADTAETFAQLTAGADEIYRNDGAAIWRLPDGVGVLSMTTPMNSCTDDVIAALRAAPRLDLKALVIGNDKAAVFSAGANLPVLAAFAEAGDEAAASEIMKAGSDAMRGLRAADFPVVAAARGAALGGGAELLIHCDHVVAHAEVKVGFPERSVGLIPAWNGTVHMLERKVDAGVANPHQEAYDLIMRAIPTDNAYDAREQHLLRESDEIVMNQVQVPSRALAAARRLAGGWERSVEKNLPLTTLPLTTDITDAQADRDIATELAEVYTGEGEASPDELAQRERAAGARLIIKPKNAARAAHMAKYRRPLKDD